MIAGWRTRDELAEIRADDLQFTPDESATFLNQLMGLNLSADEMAGLESRTEGWIAGVMAEKPIRRQLQKLGALMPPCDNRAEARSGLELR